MVRNINLILALLGGITIGIVSIFIGDDTSTFFIKVGLAILVFDVLGLVVRYIITRMMNKVDKNDTDDELVMDIQEETLEDAEAEEEAEVQEIKPLV